MKKTLALILVLVMVLGMVPTVAFAAETDVLPNHLRAELPAEVAADLAAAGRNSDYVYDWAADDFVTSADIGVTKVSDPDSVIGKAAKFDGTGTTYAGAQWYLGYSTGGVAAYVTYAMQSARANKGYQIYKFSNVKIPAGVGYLQTFSWGLQNHNINKLEGQTVDFYLSMKIEGDLDTAPVFYVDRMIFVSPNTNKEAVSGWQQRGEADLRAGFLADTHMSATNAKLTAALTAFYNIDREIDVLAFTGDMVYNDKVATGKTTSSMEEAATYFVNQDTDYDNMFAQINSKTAGKTTEQIFAMGNHEFPLNTTDANIATYAKNLFVEKTGQNVSYQTQVNGFTFVTAEYHNYEGKMMAESEAFIKAAVEESIAADATKPVFVLAHHPLSSSNTSADFYAYLSNTPQIIVITAHTHRSPWDLKTITQVPGGFTMITTSAISGDVNTPSGIDITGQSYTLMAEVNDNKATFYRMDLTKQEYIGEPWTVDVPAMVAEKAAGTTDSWIYTDARYEGKTAPAFGAGAILAVSGIGQNSATVSFPAAIPGNPADKDDIIDYYVMTTRNLTDNTVVTKNILGDYYQLAQKETISVSMTGLGAGKTYQVEMQPVSSYKVSGTALVATFTTEARKVDLGTFKVPASDTHAEAVNTDKYDIDLGGGGVKLENVVQMSYRGHVEVPITVAEDGYYDVAAVIGMSGTENRYANIWVDGVSYGPSMNQILYQCNEETDTAPQVLTTGVPLKAGDHTVRITGNDTTNLCWIYLIKTAHGYVETLTAYEGNSVSTAAELTAGGSLNYNYYAPVAGTYDIRVDASADSVGILCDGVEVASGTTASVTLEVGAHTISVANVGTDTISVEGVTVAVKTEDVATVKTFAATNYFSKTKAVVPDQWGATLGDNNYISFDFRPAVTGKYDLVFDLASDGGAVYSVKIGNLYTQEEIAAVTTGDRTVSTYAAFDQLALSSTGRYIVTITKLSGDLTVAGFRAYTHAAPDTGDSIIIEQYVGNAANCASSTTQSGMNYVKGENSGTGDAGWRVFNSGWIEFSVTIDRDGVYKVISSHSNTTTFSGWIRLYDEESASWTNLKRSGVEAYGSATKFRNFEWGELTLTKGTHRIRFHSTTSVSNNQVWLRSLMLQEVPGRAGVGCSLKVSTTTTAPMDDYITNTDWFQCYSSVGSVFRHDYGWAQWKINAPTAGYYRLNWNQACGKNATAKVFVNGEEYSMPLVATGGSQSNHRDVDAGIVSLEKGENTIRFQMNGTPFAIKYFSLNRLDAKVVNGGTTTWHENLSRAIGAAEEGAVITAVYDLVPTETVTVDKTVRLNLNGKNIIGTVTDENGLIYVDETGVLTVTGNGTINNEGTDIVNAGKVILEGGKIGEIVSTAKSGNAYYGKLSAAVAECETVELLADTDETIELNKAVTVTKNSFTASGLTVADGYELVETEDAYTVTETTVVPEKYTIAHSMQAFLQLKSVIKLGVGFILQDSEGNDVVGEEAEALLDRVGLLVWNADEVPAEAEATVENCAQVTYGGVFNPSTNRIEVATEGILSKFMGKPLAFRTFYVDEAGNYTYSRLIANYSPKTYCYNMMKNDDLFDDALMAAILNYGAAAEAFFDQVAEEDQMNADLSADLKAMNWDSSLVRSDWNVPAAKEGTLTRDSVFNSRGGSLDLAGAIDVNFYYGVTGIEVDSAEALIWTEADYLALDVLTEENASSVEPLVYKDGKYYYTQKEVAAKDMLGNLVYVCAKITDVDGNVYYSGVLCYNAERFAYVNMTNTAEPAKAVLAKRVFQYGVAAKEYFDLVN